MSEPREFERIRVIDTHTGGEPTRVVVEGGPNLGSAGLADRAKRFRQEFDRVRSAMVNEPRGADVWVGALMCEPSDPSCAAGVIFFNNVGVLGMCGHGTIGVAVALAHERRIEAGRHRLETPVGVIEFELLADGKSVTVENVPSFRTEAGVEVVLSDGRKVKGDVAWGGNWFFLIEEHGLTLDASRIDELTGFTWDVRKSLERAGVTGTEGALIDHVELFAPSPSGGLDSRNFVLCPGRAYDRSPCGTGTSAKLACLAADGKLEAGEIWRQESIIGSDFEGTYRYGESGEIIPRVTGAAWVMAEATLLLASDDPFREGIRHD
ncbi:MAG: proline racemase family protein [Planctomycetota bacterium]